MVDVLAGAILEPTRCRSLDPTARVQIMPEADLRALPIWRGDIAITPLSGGLTNLNYRVVDGDRAYAVRTGDDNPALGIDRHNELACTKAAAALGIAPNVVHSAPGVLVSDFIQSTTLTPELIAERFRLERVVDAIRSIHAAGAAIAGHLLYFSPFQVARTYLQFATERGLTLPVGAAGGALGQEIQELQELIRPFTPTFCHNDMMPGNFLDATDRIWVIDWEYAGIGHPLFDLAGLSSNCEFDAELDRRLLGAYGVDPSEHGQFRVMKAMAALRESLWAVVQGSRTTIDFDYDGYRDENYAKFLTYIGAAT